MLRLIARGLSNAEIGRELSVTDATAKTHISNVLTKLDLRDRVHAVILAYEAGVRSGRRSIPRWLTIWRALGP